MLFSLLKFKKYSTSFTFNNITYNLKLNCKTKKEYLTIKYRYESTEQLDNKNINV